MIPEGRIAITMSVFSNVLMVSSTTSGRCNGRCGFRPRLSAFAALLAISMVSAWHTRQATRLSAYRSRSINAARSPPRQPPPNRYGSRQYEELRWAEGRLITDAARRFCVPVVSARVGQPVPPEIIQKRFRARPRSSELNHQIRGLRMDKPLPSDMELIPPVLPQWALGRAFRGRYGRLSIAPFPNRAS
jgi:hypothetical protein